MRKNLVAAIIFVLVICPLALPQSRSIADRITVFSSQDVPRAVSKQRVISCLQQLAHEWQLGEKDLPNIVVFNASIKDAATAYVFKRVSVRQNGFDEAESQYFEVWLVGEPNISATVLALENVLETHLALKVTGSDRDLVMARVIRMEMGTVRVEEGK
jgi:hypothetical protein